MFEKGVLVSKLKTQASDIFSLAVCSALVNSNAIVSNEIVVV
jgi:hypothetical protein